MNQTATRPPQSNIPRWLILSMGLCLLWALLLALNWIPELRGAMEWQWPYETPNWPRLLPILCCVLLYILVAPRLSNSKAVQCWAFAGAILIPIACLYVLGDPLYLLVTRTLSGQANGSHSAAAEITDLAATLRNWPQIMPTYLQAGVHPFESRHIALSPPGLPAFYYLLNQAMAALPPLSDKLGMALRPFQCQNFAIMAYSNAQLASAWFGVLMPVWGGLAVFPLYRLGGKWAALWWPLVPAFTMFTPDWNVLYPLLALLSYFLLDRALHAWNDRPAASAALAFLSAVIVSLATFANISVVPLAAFLFLYVALFIVRALQNQQLSRSQLAALTFRAGLPFLIGLISVWALYAAFFGVTPMQILAEALGRHLAADYPYLPWIFLNGYDLAMFTGLPLICLATARMLRSVRLNEQRRLEISDGLALALGLSLLVLLLSGTARGETGRVWLFFSPFVLILAARQVQIVAGAPGESRFRGLSGTTLVTVTQAVVFVALVAFVRVLVTEFQEPPQAPPTQEAAAAALPTPLEFDSSLLLLGQRGVAAGDGIDLTLSWRAEQPIGYPYYLSALLVGPDGKPRPSNVVWQPFDNNFPMTCWRPGSVVTETRHLPLGAGHASGDYWISLSVISIVDGKAQGLPVQQSGKPDTQVGLGPISVPAQD